MLQLHTPPKKNNLKPKGYSEKWPTSFLEPASQAVCLHDIAYGDESRVQCLTPYLLLTVHSAGTASGGRGRPGYQAQWAVGGPGTGGEGLGGLCVPAQDPSVIAPSEETAFSSGTWCHQRTGRLLLVSGMVDLRGPGPHIAGRWHAPVSPGDEPCWP